MRQVVDRRVDVERERSADGVSGSDGSVGAVDIQETMLLYRRSAPRMRSLLATEALRRREAHAAAAGNPVVVEIGPHQLARPKPHPTSRPMALTLLCCLLLLLVVGALDGMQQYARIHTQVADALSHLRAAQALLDARQPGQPLETATLAQLDADLSAADADFVALRGELGSPAGVVLLGTFIPHLSGRIGAAADLASAGDEGCQGAIDLVAAAGDLLDLRARGYLDAQGQLTRRGRLSPLAGVLILHLHDALTRAAAHFDAGVAYVSPADFSVVPSSVATPAEITALDKMLANWPLLRSHLATPNGWRVLPLLMPSAPAPLR